jgi:uncharacterized repeat protein (TIGR01451 family)
MKIMGRISGSYEIPYHVAYADKTLEGSISFRVRGPEINITKELSMSEVKSGEEVDVNIKVKNIGDADAFDLTINDNVPGAVSIVSGDPNASLDVLRPGEEATLSYTVKAFTSADLGGTQLSWKDDIGNSYAAELGPVSLRVIQPPPTVTKAPPVETPAPSIGPGRLIPEEVVEERPGIEISSKEWLGVIALTVIVLAIVVKLLTIRAPVKEEE